MSILVKIIGVLTLIFSGGIGMATVAGQGLPLPEFAGWFAHPDGTPCVRFCLFGIVVGGTHIEEAQQKLENHPLTQGMRLAYGISGDDFTTTYGATILLSTNGATIVVNSVRSVVSGVSIYATPDVVRASTAKSLPILRALRSANLGAMIAWLKSPRTVSSSDLFDTETIVFPPISGARVTLLTRAAPGMDRRLAFNHELMSFAITGSLGIRLRNATGGTNVSGRWRGFTTLDYYGDRPTPIPGN